MVRPFHIALVVWGETFVQTFINVTLPNHVSHGNISDLPQGPESPHVYHIFTTRQESETIKKAHSFKRLRESIHVEFHSLDPMLEELHANNIDKHDVMTRCHAEICQIAARHKGALIVLGPELIISQGLFQALDHRVRSGARVVLVGSYRSAQMPMIEELLQKYYSPVDGSLTVPSRELVALSLKHFHHWSKSLCWNSQNFESPWPAFLYWPIGTHGLLQRGIHLCPLLSIPQRGDELWAVPKGRGIDGADYVDRISPNFEGVHVVVDSDELCVTGLTEDKPERPYDTPNIFDIALWMTQHAFPNHVYFFKEKIRFHSEDFSDEWNLVESASDQVVEGILACYQLLQHFPLAKTHLERRLDAQSIVQNYIGGLQEENALTYTVLGLEYYENGKLHDAERVLHRAITLNPGQKDAHYLLGIIYDTQGQFDRALHHLKTTVTLQPDNLNGWKRLAALSMRLGQLQLATECQNAIAMLAS